jgi:hypothetical protein
LNDCLYRSRALGFEYVVSGDVDEVNFPNFTAYKQDSPDGALVELARSLARRQPKVAGWHFRIKQHYLVYPDGDSKEVQNYLKEGKLKQPSPVFGVGPTADLRLRTNGELQGQKCWLGPTWLEAWIRTKL